MRIVNSANKNTANKIVYPELSYKIVGILFRVHNVLGNRYQEKYYQRALAAEFDAQNVRYKREVSVELTFNGKTIGKYYLDFFIEDKIILEIKTVPKLIPQDFKQVRAYLKAKNIRLGLLVNFRNERLHVCRILSPL